MNKIIFLLLCSTASSAPPGKRPSDTDSDVPAKILKDVANTIVNDECYFHTERRTSLETQPRTKYTTISTNCEGPLITMDSLIDNPSYVSHFGEKNELELVILRGEGNFHSNVLDKSFWRKQKICASHRNELSQHWDNFFLFSHWPRAHSGTTNVDKCIFEDDNKKKYHVNKEMAEQYMRTHGTLLHLGMPVCEKCYAERFFDSKCDPEFKRAPDQHPSSRASFLQFAKDSKVSNVCPRKEYHLLATETKEKKAQKLYQLLKEMVHHMAPDSEHGLLQLFFDRHSAQWKSSSSTNTQYSALMFSIATHYARATTKREKDIILCYIVDVLTLSEIREYIPDLAERRYYDAKRTSRELKRAEQEEQVHRRERYNAVAVDHFIHFITGPAVLAGLPYGQRDLKLSTGQPITIPNTLRIQRASEIVKMYTRELEREGLQDLKLHDSTLFLMLKVCAATKRRATTCVDYFIASGMEAYDDLQKMLDDLKHRNIIDDEFEKKMNLKLAQDRMYIRGDYRLHVKQRSRIASHCFVHALSDPSNRLFRGKCDHKHDLQCDQCLKLEDNVSEIEEVLADVRADMPPDDPNIEVVEEALYSVKKNQESISDLHRHQIRVMFSESVRANIIASLKNGEGLITADWAQKWDPMWHRETQPQYYGKAGTSYHVLHIFVKLANIEAQHTMAHVFTGGKQDSVAITQLFEDALSRLYLVGVRAVHLRTDNAAAYHSSSTLASLPAISKRTQVKILSYSYSEAQNGKAACDRMAAKIKMHVRDFVNQGGKASTPEGFFNAINSNSPSPLDALSVYLVSAEDVPKSSTEIDHISDLGHFEYSDNEMRAWKFKDIGEGMRIPIADLKENGGKLIVIAEGGYLPHNHPNEIPKLEQGKSSFWFGCPQEKCPDVEEENDESDATEKRHEEEELGTTTTVSPLKGADGKQRLYYCPTPGCSARFLRQKNLLRHIDFGKHNLVPERISQSDYALQRFKNDIESIRTQQLIQPVEDALANLDKWPEGRALPDQGWAIRTRKCTRHSPLVKKYLSSLFEEAVAKKKRYDPQDVEEMMKKTTGEYKFKPSERLNAKQIQSVFTRLSRERDTRQKRSPSDAEVAGMDTDYLEICDDYDETLFDDPNTIFPDDALYMAVADHREELFLN